MPTRRTATVEFVRGSVRGSRRRALATLPSLFTLANMGCGFGAILVSIRGEHGLAAVLIGLSVLFDIVDGAVARKVGAVTPFGLQFDSLADLVSFGLAPALLAFTLFSEGRDEWDVLGWVACFLWVACAAIRLARFNVLDTRLFRSDQACGDGAQTDCADRLSRDRTVLGADQEHWLYRRLDSSHAIWNVIPQQMIMAQCDIDPGPAQKYFMDIWDGYTASRDRLLTHLARARVSNPVVLTGDVHRHFAAELRSDFDDPDSTTLGVELVCSSIASGRDGADLDEHCHTVLDNNPHFRFANAQRGYLVNTMTPQMLRTDFRVVPYISRPGAGVSTRTTLVTESGRPGLQPG